MNDIKIIISGVSVINVQISNFNTNKIIESNLIDCVERYYKNNKIKIRQIVNNEYNLNVIEKRLLLLIKQENTELVGVNFDEFCYDKNEDFPFEAQILIPYRARGNNKFRELQLSNFLKHMKKYMKTIHENVNYKLIILEQDNDHPFNRGLLLNAGYIECENGINQYIKYYIHHNCDLFPEIVKGLDYGYTPQHEIRDIFGYHGGLGGICIFNRHSYKKANGFPNDYFSWGHEDVIIKTRCEKKNITIKRPNYNDYIAEEGHIRDSSFNSINQEKGRNDKADNGLTTCKYIAKIKNTDSSNVIHYLIDFDW
jgi:hypothetical protein